MSVIRVVFTVALLTVGGAWFFTFRPGFLGGPAGYVLVSGKSMEPTLYSGDLVVTRQQSEYGVGDVVAFRAQGGMVIHRIVGGNAQQGFSVQGDNKNGPDAWRPTPHDIVGKQWFTVPGGARFLLPLREPINLALLASGLGVLIVLLSDWHVAFAGPGRRKRHPPGGSEKA